MWKLDEALALIRVLQPRCHKKGFHVCLGGGVLNEGQSDNDLDLYFFPLEDESNHPDDINQANILDIMSIVHQVTGAFGTNMPDYENIRSSYRNKLRYVDADKRVIDVFIR